MKKIFLILYAILCFSNYTYCKVPHWYRKVPVSSKKTYYYNVGYLPRVDRDIKSKMEAKEKLFLNLLEKGSQKLGYELVVDEKILNKIEWNDNSSPTSNTFSGSIETDVKKLKFFKVSDYYDKSSKKYYLLLGFNKLYNTVTHKKVVLGEGVNGMLKSLMLPSLGQWYKKNYVKAPIISALMLGAASMIAICEITRTNYINRIKNYLSYNSEQYYLDVERYRDEAKNYELYRNISIGVLGAVFIYNLIDAYFAPSNLYVKNDLLKRFEFNPYYINDQHYGLNLSFKINQKIFNKNNFLKITH